MSASIRWLVACRTLKTRQVWIPGPGLITVQRLTCERAPWWFFGNLIGQTERWTLPDGRHLRAQRQGPDEWALSWWAEVEGLTVVRPQGDPAGV